MTFDDLKFEQHSNWLDGVQAKVFFSNGYGASIIRSQFSYGGREGLYELAVLQRIGENDFTLCYDTPLTDDVIGGLKPEEVTELLDKIEALPEVIVNANS